MTDNWIGDWYCTNHDDYASTYQHFEKLTKNDMLGMSMKDYKIYREKMGLEDSYRNSVVGETAEFLFPAAFNRLEQAWKQSAFLDQYGSFYSQPERIVSSHSHKYEKATDETTLRRYPKDTKEKLLKDHQKLLQTIQHEKEQSVKSVAKELSYTDLYWKYVNATDTVEAADYLKRMLDKVTPTMEPAKSGKSWVEEPATTKSPAKTVNKEISLGRYCMFVASTFLIAQLLFILLGLIH